MRRFAAPWAGFLLLLLAWPMEGREARAQQAPPRTAQIRKIVWDSKIETPQYALRKSQFVGRSRNWTQITVLYETAPEWIDEAVFTVYVLLKSRTAPARLTVMRGEVTYINIARGTGGAAHKADFYLHPSTMDRYGDIERVGVLIKPVGGMMVVGSEPTSDQRWWEQMAAPLDGYVLNRMQTPFAMINFDDYEAIKFAGNAR